MKSNTHIIAAFLLFLMISIYYVQVIIEKQNCALAKIEYSDTSNSSQWLTSPESIFDDDSPVVTSLNPCLFINSGCESISAFIYLHSEELHYSIWQPPKISWLISHLLAFFTYFKPGIIFCLVWSQWHSPSGYWEYP